MVSQLVLGMINFLPGIAVLYLFIGRYDEHFRHNAMFLVLLGGMAVGLAAGFVELIIMADAGALIVLISLPLIETMGKTMIVGLPRFRGEREAVLLGGATGLGVAAMVLMTYGQYLGQREVATTWQLLVTLVTVAVGFTLVHYISGLVLGTGPAEGRLLSRFVVSAGLLYPAHLLLFLMGLNTATGQVEPFLSASRIEFGLLIALYGLVLLWRKGEDLLKEGLSAEARRQLRREKMKAARQGGGS